MSGWAPKRFWTRVTVERTGDGVEILLDKRPVRTPGKSPLALPGHALAEAIAAEWEAQERTVDPRTMPLTRMANSAIEKVAPQKDDVASYLAEYAGTDLLCYRAEGPEGLVARQEAAWNPWLAWAEARFGVKFATTQGVMPVEQAEDVVPAVRSHLSGFDPFELVAVHDLIGISGSAILGLAAAAGAGAPEDLWSVSRIDEDWQAEEWGRDEEAEAVRLLKRRDFLDAARFLDLARRD